MTNDGLTRYICSEKIVNPITSAIRRDSDERAHIWCVMEQEKKQAKNPPLGLIPRSIWEEKRIDDIIGAIGRFTDARKPIPVEWVEEYNELVRRRCENW